MICVTDASLHSDTKQSTGASLFITKSTYFVETFDLSTCFPDDSSRAEIATVSAALITAKEKLKHMDIQRVSVWTDSKVGIDSLEKARDSTISGYQIHGFDLIVPIKNDLSIIELVKVRGHDKENADNLNHLVDKFTHCHKKSSKLPFKIKNLAGIKGAQSKEKRTGFRLYQMLYKSMNKDLVLGKLKELHDELLGAD